MFFYILMFNCKVGKGSRNKGWQIEFIVFSKFFKFLESIKVKLYFNNLMVVKDRIEFKIKGFVKNKFVVIF